MRPIRPTKAPVETWPAPLPLEVEAGGLPPEVDEPLESLPPLDVEEESLPVEVLEPPV